MTTTAAAAMTARTTSRLRSWLAVRHSLPSEAAEVLVVYGLYELARGLVVSDTGKATRHARQLERSSERRTFSSKPICSRLRTRGPVSPACSTPPT